MRANPHIEGVMVRLNTIEMFNIVSFTQDAEAPRAFKFEEVAFADQNPEAD
jgi:hypothetical protein